MPSAATYAHRFGSLIRAYRAVGFTPDRDYQYLETNQFLRRLHPEVIGHTERMIAEVGGTVERDPATDLLTVNREFSLSLVLSRCQLLDSGRRRWKLLDNKAVFRFLSKHQPEVLSQFENIVQTVTLDGKSI